MLETDLAWSTAYYAYTIQFAARHNVTDTARLKQIALSPMLPYQQLTKDCDKGEGQGLPDVATYIRDHGNVPHAQYPFTSCVQKPTGDWLAQASQNRPIKDVVKLFGPDKTSAQIISRIREQLDIHKTPIIVGIQRTTKLIKLTAADEFYQPKEGESYMGLHAVTVVGYDPNGFKLVNSWGKKWGKDGYFWIRYKDFVRIAVGGIVLVLPEAKTPPTLTR